VFSEADIDRAKYLTGNVKDSLDTTKKWSLHDFREFYQRDIAAAIQLAAAVIREANEEIDLNTAYARAQHALDVLRAHKHAPPGIKGLQQTLQLIRENALAIKETPHA